MKKEIFGQKTCVDIYHLLSEYRTLLVPICHTKTMMLQTQRQLLRLSSANFLFPSLPLAPFPQHLYFPGRAAKHHYSLCSAHRAWVAQLSEEVTATVQAAAEGPIELPSSISSIVSAASVDSGGLQTAASWLITGSFTLFLFSTLRRSARRAKQRKLRSEAVLKVEGKKRKRASAGEALAGALIAAAFGVLLYKFTTTVEFNLNNQPLSPNYSVRQITITIRTIINGMCYLATFVFAFNSVGLFLYSGQLAINSQPLNSPSPDNTQTQDQTSDNQQN